LTGPAAGDQRRVHSRARPHREPADTVGRPRDLRLRTLLGEFAEEGLLRRAAAAIPAGRWEARGGFVFQPQTPSARRWPLRDSTPRTHDWGPRAAGRVAFTPWRHPFRSANRADRSAAALAASTTRRPGKLQGRGAGPTPGSRAGGPDTLLLLGSTRRCTPRAAARLPEERPVDEHSRRRHRPPAARSPGHGPGPAWSAIRSSAWAETARCGLKFRSAP